MRVALIKIGALGDVLRTTALLPALRRLDRELELTWISSRDALPMLQHNQLVTRAVDYRTSQELEWRPIRYDWVISLDEEADVCRLASRLQSAKLSGAYEDSGGAIRYTPDVDEWFGMGRLRRAENGGLARANQLKRANLHDYGEILYRALRLPLPVARPTLVVPEDERAWAAEWLRSRGMRGRTLVSLNTGAGGRWRFKSWGVESTAKLAKQLAESFDASVLVLGGIAEQERNAEIVACADSAAVVAAPSDTSILSFAALIGHTTVLVSSDSLAMHVGIALERPVVAFFGPTSQTEINLFGRGEKVVTPLECRCCYLSDCNVRPHCMQSIGVETIFAAVSRLLPGRAPVGNAAA